MKTIWEPKDIVCGRIVCSGTVLNRKPTSELGWYAKHTYKIGYIGGSSYSPPEEGNQAFGICLIAMTDGMVIGPHPKEYWVNYFNNYGMIIAPNEWVTKLMEYLRDIY